MLNLVKNIIKRCRITLAGKDDTDFRVQQIGMNGKALDAEVYAPYGMSYNVPVDSLCVYLQVGGDSGTLIVLPDRSEDRIKDLKAGEVAFFNPLTQSRTVFKENGDIETTINGAMITTIKGDKTVTVSGAMNINVTGDCNLTANDVNITASGNVDIDSSGTVDITGSGAVGISGSTVNLN